MSPEREDPGQRPLPVAGDERGSFIGEHSGGYDGFMADPAHVTLSGDIEGEYVVEEARPDGRLVVAPEWPSANTSITAVRKRLGTRAMTPEEFDRHFGDLPRDGEG